MLKDLEKTLKATSDRTRLRILKMLDTSPLCVCEIVAALGLSQSTVSKHLSILVSAGLVEDERRGRWTLYALTPSGERGGAAKLMLVIAEGLRDDPHAKMDAIKLNSAAVRALTRDCPIPRKRGLSRAGGNSR